MPVTDLPVKPPIFIDNRGDVLAFRSARAAAVYIEAIDVEHSEYVGYDSAGRLLEIAVERSDAWPNFRPTRIRLRSAEAGPGHAADLRRVLETFLERVEKTDEATAGHSLEELVTRMAKYVVR